MVVTIRTATMAVTISIITTGTTINIVTRGAIIVIELGWLAAMVAPDTIAIGEAPARFD
jgi:hypothetical protein